MKGYRQAMDKSEYPFLPNRNDHPCFGCGPKNPVRFQMQFYTDGAVVVSWVTIPQHLRGWKDLAHGGILFTILDGIMARSVI